MRRIKTKWIVAAAALIGVVSIWESPLVPQQTMYCEYQNTRDEHCATSDVTLVLLWKIGDLLDHHGEAVTALFTIVLAVFTGRLWYSTEGLFRVTKIVADADRPHMLPSEFRVSGIRDAPGEDGNVKVSVDFKFANYGRSPAFMKSFCVMCRVNRELPPYPEYIGLIATNRIIAVNGWWGSGGPIGVLITANDVADILVDRSTLVIIGKIEYGDAAQQTHAMRFAYRIEFDEGNTTDRFHPFGPDSYHEYT